MFLICMEKGKAVKLLNTVLRSAFGPSFTLFHDSVAPPDYVQFQQLNQSLLTEKLQKLTLFQLSRRRVGKEAVVEGQSREN